MDKLKYVLNNKNNEIIVLENETVIGKIQFSIDNCIMINELFINETESNKENTIVEGLISKLVILNYYLHKHIVNNTKYSLVNHHFENLEGFEILNTESIKIKRFVSIGEGITGDKNNLCDVKGVSVGHFTIHDDVYNTGVTVISPHEGNIFKEKVVASSYSYNGFGKSVGLVQIEELGTIESNIVFTSTMNVGKISDGVIAKALEENSDIAITTGTINPVIMECNDGNLNKSRDRILGRLSYYKALEELNDDFLQGDVGAGAGMICHGFKGGIGSSSRIITFDGKEYTIGIIVNSNFGSSNGNDLIFKGRLLKDRIKKYLSDEEDKGSIVAVVATDLPLNERQIKRVLKRVEIGIGRTGSYAGNGSGDVFVGFSTVNKRNHYPEKTINNDLEYFNDDKISVIFKRIVEATEEAVLNSMLFSQHTKGYLKEVKSLNEVSSEFFDLFDEEIIWDIK